MAIKKDRVISELMGVISDLKSAMTPEDSVVILNEMSHDFCERLRDLFTCYEYYRKL